MKFRYLKYLSILFIVFASSCGKDSKHDCFKRTGVGMCEIRNISGYNKIEINGKLDVVLTSEESELSISGGENLLPKITTKLQDSTLIIDNKNKYNLTRSYKKVDILVSIPVNNLKELVVNGKGSISSMDTISANYLTISFVTGISDLNLKLKTTNLELVVHDGGGDIILSGTSQNVNIYNNGYAYVDLGKLQSSYVFLANKSQNKTFINASNRIDVEIYDVGNVYYTGNPQEINLQSYSDGKLIELN